MTWDRLHLLGSLFHFRLYVGVIAAIAVLHGIFSTVNAVQLSIARSEIELVDSSIRSLQGFSVVSNDPDLRNMSSTREWNNANPATVIATRELLAARRLELAEAIAQQSPPSPAFERAHQAAVNVLSGRPTPLEPLALERRIIILGFGAVAWIIAGLIFKLSCPICVQLWLQDPTQKLGLNEFLQHQFSTNKVEKGRMLQKYDAIFEAEGEDQATALNRIAFEAMTAPTLWRWTCTVFYLLAIGGVIFWCIFKAVDIARYASG